MEFLWHSEAVAEAHAATSFYYQKQRELGLRFLHSLDEALRRIELNPGIYRDADPGVRKCKAIAGKEDTGLRRTFVRLQGAKAGA